MKDIHTIILLAALAASTSILAARQPSNAAENATSNAPATTNAVTAAPAKEPAPPPAATTAADTVQQIPQPVTPDPAAPGSALPAADAQQTASTNTPGSVGENSASVPEAAANNGTNGLFLNFHNAPLDRVLNYMSEAAGFIVVLEARPRGTVDVWSNRPVTKDEAVNLLDQALKKNGYAAIRNERTLTIVPRDEAKTHDIPVFVGADPAAIPRTDRIVTQIIPVRYVEVAQLVKDLQPLVSTQTTMTANESGNEIVITDTQAVIHKVAEIIKAIDAGAEDSTVVRVFPLKYADPSELSDLLVNLFPDDSRSGGSSAPVQFGGFGGLRSFFRGGGGGGPGGGAPGGGGGGSNNQNQRIKKRARVIAVPDPRTSSIAVTASRDLMDQIEGVITELDSNPAKVKKVKVFKVENADVQQMQQLLQDTFTSNGQSSQRGANQNSVLTTRGSQQSGASTSTTTSRGGSSSRGGGMASGFGQ